MKQPPLITPREVDVPRAQRHTLPNGASLYAIPSDDFEVLRFTFVFRAGSSMQHAPFAASATANMLSEGSRDMTARQIAERLDFHGSYFEVNVDRDYVYISFSSLSKFFAPTLEVAEQILLQPLFPEDELRAYCEKRKQTLTIERRKVDTVVREIFAEALFGDKHPYGISYPEKDYDTLTRADLESLYRRLYTAENCLVVCSGRIGEEELQGIGALAEKLPRADRSATADFPAPRSEAYRFVERPDAVQSSLRVGRLLFTRTHPDFVGMQVVATVLGGYFGSRLMQNLRGEHGYTYGVGAAMVNFEREGYLGIAAQVGAEVTAPALREIYNEIERLRREPMPEEELSLVKNIMTGEVMRILDGPFGIADVTIENLLCGTNNGVIEENIRRIQAITPAEVQRLAVSAAKILSRPSWERSIQSMRFNGKRLSSIKRIRPENRAVCVLSKLYSVRIHPPCQFDEIGDRKLLGTLREEGMFRPSEIAESRPQGVAQHLAALAERGLDHADEQPFVAVEPVHSVAAQTHDGALDFGRRIEHRFIDRKQVLYVIPCLQQHAQDAVLLRAGRLRQTHGDLFLDHPDAFRNQVPVFEHLEKYLGRNIVREIADHTQSFGKQRPQIHFQEIALHKAGCKFGIMRMQIRHAFGVYFGAVCHDIRPFQQKLGQNTHAASHLQHRTRPFGRTAAQRIAYFAGNIEIDQKMLAQRFLRSYFTHSFRLNIFPGASIPDSSGTEPIFSVSADGDRFAPTVRHLPQQIALFGRLSETSYPFFERRRVRDAHPFDSAPTTETARRRIRRPACFPPPDRLPPPLPRLTGRRKLRTGLSDTQSSEVFLHILDMLARFLVKFVVKHCDARDDEKHRNNQVRIMTVVQAPNDIDRKPHDRSQHKNQRDGRRLLVKLCVLLFHSFSIYG